MSMPGALKCNHCDFRYQSISDSQVIDGVSCHGCFLLCTNCATSYFACDDKSYQDNNISLPYLQQRINLYRHDKFGSHRKTVGKKRISVGIYQWVKTGLSLKQQEVFDFYSQLEIRCTNCGQSTIVKNPAVGSVCPWCKQGKIWWDDEGGL